MSQPKSGHSAPLGATVVAGGVNFSVFTRHATRVELLFFEADDASAPSRVIELQHGVNHTFPYWHVFVPGVGPGQIYGFRVDGPNRPERGLRFDPDKILLDPYSKLVAIPAGYDRGAASRPGPNVRESMKSLVVDPTAYDWEGDEPLRHPWVRTVIYELHVAGFTRHPSSGVSEALRGTYAGLVEKIPYLQALGITAVELLPVFQFDEQDAPLGQRNYWGYAPISLFAPHRAYCSRRSPLGPLDEFRDMVKAMHRAGLEVILDVVYNHTSEGDESGPVACFKGFDNETYYLLNEFGYANYSGTGNTLKGNNSVVRRLIQDSLKYWVEQLHVDGFRFDLASILARDRHGRVLDYPHTLWSIETDPVLAGTKLIAEPWDAGGLYQVGSFVGDRWREWNGQFRDDVRSFIKSDPGQVAALANRLLASPDLYGHQTREPEQSVNFVTCHDGFTLNDLVSYNVKHNWANGEQNRDGDNHNLSWNCGVEGPTDDPDVERLRNRQVKNLLALTVIAAGVPMLLMGDEVRRTQLGNNNAYSQDNETSWFDWRGLERHADVHRFVSLLLQWRHRGGPERDSHLSLTQFIEEAEIDFHGVRLYQPDWGDLSRSLAVTARGRRGWLHGMFNAYWRPLEFELPVAERRWRRLLDTALDSPDDIVPPDEAPRVVDSRYLVQPRSTVVLIE